jgi:hypothetical protein
LYLVVNDHHSIIKIDGVQLPNTISFKGENKKPPVFGGYSLTILIRNYAIDRSPI